MQFLKDEVGIWTLRLRSGILGETSPDWRGAGGVAAAAGCGGNERIAEPRKAGCPRDCPDRNGPGNLAKPDHTKIGKVAPLSLKPSTKPEIFTTCFIE